MAKRLTDTVKWDKIWFRKLKPLHKCMWFYICDKCDHAGIWEVDFETAEYYIGEKLDIKQIEEVFAKQFKSIDNGKRWIIIDFITFQYGQLDETNKMYKPISASLIRYGVSMGDIWGVYPLKVIVKDKDKVKDKGKKRFLTHVLLTEEEYGKLQERFGDTLESRIKNLDDYIAIKKPGYHDHYRVILKWAEKEPKPIEVAKW